MSWKKLKYFVMVIQGIDEHPLKCWTLMPSLLISSLSFNLQITETMIVSETVGEVLSFAVIDWCNWTFNLLMVSRFVVKLSPKFGKSLLANELKNILRPFPKTGAAKGERVAMSIMHGLTFLIDGTTLTSNFGYFCCYFVLWGCIIENNDICLLAPIKNNNGVLAVAIMTAIFGCGTTAQDLMAQKVSGRICNYSFIYVSKGWFHQRHGLQRLILGSVWAGIIHQCGYGAHSGFKKHKDSMRPLVQWESHMSICGTFHL